MTSAAFLQPVSAGLISTLISELDAHLKKGVDDIALRQSFSLVKGKVSIATKMLTKSTKKLSKTERWKAVFASAMSGCCGPATCTKRSQQRWRC